MASQQQQALAAFMTRSQIKNQHLLQYSTATLRIFQSCYEQIMHKQIAVLVCLLTCSLTHCNAGAFRLQSANMLLASCATVTELST